MGGGHDSGHVIGDDGDGRLVVVLDWAGGRRRCCHLLLKLLLLEEALGEIFLSLVVKLVLLRLGLLHPRVQEDLLQFDATLRGHAEAAANQVLNS